MTAPALVALSIGSNLGDREFFIDSMERELRLILDDVAVSGLMETEPVGVGVPQPAYLNEIITGYYGNTPRRLLGGCFEIESRLGRTREARRGPRTADVDILLFGELEISESTPPDALVVPHPELLNRRFCLEGLMRIDPGIIIPLPGDRRTVGELYKNMGTDVAAQNVYFIR